jgi:hypothetical protein
VNLYLNVRTGDAPAEFVYVHSVCNWLLLSLIDELCIHALRYLGRILFSSGIASSDFRLSGHVPLRLFVSFVSLACLNSFLRGPMATVSSSPSSEPALARSFPFPFPFSFLLASSSFSCSTELIAQNISTTPSISGPATIALATPTSSALSIPPLHTGPSPSPEAPLHIDERVPLHLPVLVELPRL